MDYPALIEELQDFVQDRMGIADRQAVALCLSCHLPIHQRSPYPPPWICVDTQMIQPSVSWFTFGFDNQTLKKEGELSRTIYISQLKRLRPYRAKAIIDSVISCRKSNKLFVDALYMSRQKVLQRHAYWDLIPHMLRLRVDCPYSHLPNRTDMQNLYELTRLCIDNRPDRLKVMPWKPSNYILDRLRTLTRVNPDLTQWDSLYMNISMLVSAHARLFGREEPEELDIYAGVRCLRDSIRWRERAILDVILEKDGWVFKQKIRERTGMELQELSPVLNRMTESGVIKKTHLMYALKDETIIDLIKCPY